MFENISKDERNRYLTIAVILLFVFSTIAIYISTPSNQGSGTQTNTPAASAANATYSFTGRGTANATLMRWDPALFVRGPDPRLADTLAELGAGGVVVKDVPQAGGHILTLADSRLIRNVTEYMAGLNVTILGNGIISMPSAFVEGNGISRMVGGGTYYYQDTPQFEEGDVFPIAFDAMVEGQGLKYGPQNIIVLQGGIVDAEVTPLNVTVNQTFLQFTLPWEQRNIEVGQYQSNLVGGDRVKFRQKSIVYFKQLLSDTQLAQLRGNRPSWAAADAEEGLIGVKTNVTNKTAVSADLARLGIEAVFPLTTVEVYPYMIGRNWSQIENDTARIWYETYPNMTVDFKPGYRLMVTLPPTISVNGQTYIVRQQALLMQSNYPPMENGTLKLSFQPRGKQFDSAKTAFYSPKGVVEQIQ
ncbi:Uncharacterised protein [uncultured archaeon]|nr:Uncharacterised protein [uncultured archaeon]